jgi:hypothetical protein
MEPASIDPALPVFPLDGDSLNDPLNDLDLFDDSLGFNMGPIDKEYSKSSSISGHGELPTSLGDISDADADKFNPTEFFSMINQTNFESPSRQEFQYLPFQPETYGTVPYHPDSRYYVRSQLYSHTECRNIQQSNEYQDSGAGSLSPTSSQSISPVSTPIHTNGQITISIQPQPQTQKAITTRRLVAKETKKSAPKSKKARLDPVIPKIEILNDSDPEYHETNPIYVETSPDQNDKFQVTAEEQEVLTREGWELTEKNLKKARRKIKNKISAQESRKRKRDYVNNLEERISDFTSENQQLKRDLEKERSEKKTLMSQLRELQAVVGSRFQSKNTKSTGTQTSAAVMVVLLCCTVFKGTFSSTNEEIKNEKTIHDELDFDYSTPSYKSRVLKCFTDDDIDFCSVESGMEEYPTIDFDPSDSEDDANSLSDWSDGLTDKLTSQIEAMTLEGAMVAEHKPKNLSQSEVKYF